MRSRAAAALCAAPFGAVLLGAALLACGCDVIKDTASAKDSPTGGVEMSLAIKRPSQQIYEMYVVNKEGSLEYGGGLTAFNDHTNWSHPLSPEQISKFMEVLASTNWCQDEPVHSDASEPIISIAVRCQEGRHTWNFKGESASVASMRGWAEPITLQRFKSQLDRLPEATERPKKPPTETQPSAPSAPPAPPAPLAPTPPGP